MIHAPGTVSWKDLPQWHGSQCTCITEIQTCLSCSR